MLYIVRHGQTAKNKQKVLQGRSDIPMNDEGKAQAEAAGGKLAEHGVCASRIYSSPLIRAVQTAEIIGARAGSPDVPVQTDERLIEMDYGPYEGMDLTSPAPEVMAFFMDFAGTPAPEGMEQLSAVVSRAGEFLEEIKEEAGRGDVIISTHAIAMKGLLEYLTPDSNGGYWSRYVGNCEVYAVEVSDGEYGVPYPFCALGPEQPGV